MKNWKKNSWRKYPVKHIPEYPNKKDLDMVLDKLGTFPPLVFAGETRHLKSQLAEVVDGKAFLLQGGDCAESFAEFNPDNIRDTFKLMLQMSLVLTYSASLPVVKVGRIAGQFSKPRSSPVESKDGIELPSYLGDNINGMEFNEKSRVPDPKRLFKAYSQSAATLNLIRAFCHGGFADLQNVHTWNLGFIKNSPELKRFKELEDRIADALAFMDACGINSDFNRRLKTVNFWTSHEALLLPFEETMTRTDSTTGENHDTSADVSWFSPVVESVLVIVSSNGNNSASCEVQKLTVFNLLLKSELIPHASMNAKASAILSSNSLNLFNSGLFLINPRFHV